MEHRRLAQPTAGSELRAIIAVARKEWRIFRRYPSWIVAFFVWPVLFPIGYIFSARALGGPDESALPAFARVAGTTDYVGFIVIGSVLWMWLNMTLWDFGHQLRSEQLRGTLESNWLAPVPRMALMLGGGLTKLATSLFMLLITVAEFRLLFGVDLLRGDPWLLLLVLGLVILSIYGIGLAFASLVLRFREANAMVFLVRGIFMIFCGMTFPLAVLPSWMQAVAAWLPLTYATHALREIILRGATLAEIMPDVRALALFGLALPVAGYLAFTLVDRRARRTGSLGQY